MKKPALPFLALILVVTAGSAQSPPASSLIDSLTARLSTLPDDSSKVNTLHALSNAHMAEFDNANGLRRATEALQLARVLGDRKAEAFSDRLIAANHYYLNAYDEALVAAQEALRLNQELRDTTAIAASYDQIGTIHLDRRDLKEALENSLTALELREQVGDRKLIANSRINVGNAHAEMGQYHHALRNYFDALRLLNEFDDQGWLAANTYNSVGTVYGEMGDPEEALKNFQAAQDRWARQKDRKGLARAHMNMGHAYAQMGDRQKALEQFQVARALKSETKDRYGVAMADNNIADIYKQQERYDEALATLRATLPLMEEIGDKDGIAGGHIAIGEILLALHKHVQARTELLEGLRIAKSEGYPIRQQVGYELMAAVDSALGDPAAALAHYKLHIAMRDSLMDEEKIKQITRLELQYDFDREQLTDSLRFSASLAGVEKERTIERLRANKNRDRALATGGGALLLLAGGSALFYSDRKRRRERFQKEAAELQTQVLRSQMNPHFIFNALNSINAFVQRNDAEGASSFLSKFARVMRGVLENSRQREVSLKDDLETLRGYIELERKRMEDKFDFTIHVDAAIDPEQVMVPPLVVQPLVENAIWHGIAGKEGRGHITLDVKQQADHLIWSIEDDGVGRGATKPVAEPSSTRSAGPVKKTSLGTSITRDRLELLKQQYGGRAGFRYEDLPQGTRVVVDMPLIFA